MQTILGAGGVIARELAKNLTAYTGRIRLVSRHPRAVNPGDEIVSADLLDPELTLRAVEGSGVVYLTGGLLRTRHAAELRECHGVRKLQKR